MHNFHPQQLQSAHDLSELTYRGSSHSTRIHHRRNGNYRPVRRGKHIPPEGRPKRNHRLSLLFLFVVVGCLLVSSRVGFTSIVTLGNKTLRLSSSAVRLGLVTKQRSLKSLVQEEENESHFSNEKVWPKPYGWESYSFGLIRKHFACKACAHDQKKPLPTLQDWQLFRSQYSEMVDNKHIFRDDPVPPTMGYTLSDTRGPPPYYAEHSADGRGRGLFASRDIKKGELVHDGTDSDVMFPDAMSWRRFIFSLPRNRACDMIDWTWTQKLEENGKHRIFAAINISILLNGGKDGKNVNINPDSSTSSKFYATRDIEKGEELLTNYKMYDTKWAEVGLGENTIVYSSGPLVQEHEPYIEPVWPKRSGWEFESIEHILKYFHCEAYIKDANKPLPTIQDWKMFQSHYKKHVDNTRSFYDTVPPTMGYTLEGSGGPPPFYAKHSPGKGRGLFASRDIKRGELTHDGTNTNVMFPDGLSWRRFVFSLPRNRACDIIDWTWTQQIETNSDEYGIFSAINISVLHNGGRGNDANVNPRSPTSSKFYATRDIKKDEELLTDYFIYDVAWEEVGLF